MRGQRPLARWSGRRWWRQHWRGATVEEIAVRLGLARNTVYLWLHRFAARGSPGLSQLAKEELTPPPHRDTILAMIQRMLSAHSAPHHDSARGWTIHRNRNRRTSLLAA